MTEAKDAEQQKSTGGLRLLERAITSTALAAGLCMFVGYMNVWSALLFEFQYGGPVFNLVGPDQVLMEGATAVLYHYAAMIVMGLAVSALLLRFLSPAVVRRTVYVIGGLMVVTNSVLWWLQQLRPQPAWNLWVWMRRQGDPIAYVGFATSFFLTLAVGRGAVPLLLRRPFAKACALIVVWGQLLLLIVMLVPGVVRFAVASVRFRQGPEQRLAYFGLSEGFFLLGDWVNKKVLMVPQDSVTLVVMEYLQARSGTDLDGYCKKQGKQRAVNADESVYGWRCVPGDVAIDFQQVCLEQWGPAAIPIAPSIGQSRDWTCRH